MSMIKLKTARLTGAALDWAVAKATGAGELKIVQECGGKTVSCIYELPEGGCWTNHYTPSTDWSQGGPLLETYNIQLNFNGHGHGGFCAYVCRDNGVEWFPSGGGKTHLVAACRAIVASKFPDEIEVPAELAEGQA